ncbi:MAG: hypothetical protein WC128_05925, partial [Bacteroidales bacterium]
VVEEGADFIRLGNTAGNTVLNGTVGGNAGSQVRFFYQADSPTASATTNRFGSIRVTYEDGMLEHIVYVRQGYGDVQMTAGGTWWSTFNALGNVGADAGFKQNPFAPSKQFGTYLTTFPTHTGWFFKWGNNGGMHPSVPGPGDANTQKLELTLTVAGNPNANLLTGWATVTKNIYNWNVTTNSRGPCPDGYVVATSAQYTSLSSSLMLPGYVFDDMGVAIGALMIGTGSANLFFPMGWDGYGIRDGTNSGALDYAVTGAPSAWYWARGASGSTAVAHAEFAIGDGSLGVLPIPNVTTAGITQDSGKFVRCVRQ